MTFSDSCHLANWALSFWHAIQSKLNRRKVSWSGRLLLSSKSASALRSTGICPPNSDISPQPSGILDELQGNRPGKAEKRHLLKGAAGIAYCEQRYLPCEYGPAHGLPRPVKRFEARANLEFHAQTPIDRKRCTWAERARIGQIQERYFGCIEKRAEGVVAPIEQILN